MIRTHNTWEIPNTRIVHRGVIRNRHCVKSYVFQSCRILRADLVTSGTPPFFNRPILCASSDRNSLQSRKSPTLYSRSIYNNSKHISRPHYMAKVISSNKNIRIRLQHTTCWYLYMHCNNTTSNKLHRTTKWQWTATLQTYLTLSFEQRRSIASTGGTGSLTFSTCKYQLVLQRAKYFMYM